MASKEKEIAKLEKRASGPNFCDDTETAQAAMRRLSSLREEVERWNTLKQRGQDALELSALDDESLREDIMPMKGKNTIDNYKRVWETCVDIFDHNEVYTMAIAGLGESDESILRGVELAASMGVVCSIVPHTPMRKAVYEDMDPPSVERMLYLYEAALPIYEKYGLKLYGGSGGIYTSLKGM